MKRIRKFVLLLTLLTLMGTQANIYAAESTETQISQPNTDTKATDAKGNISTEDFDITVVCGIRGQYKYNSAIPVNIDIKSKNADFTGTIRMIVPGSTNDGIEAIAYEKEILLTKDSSKHISMSVYSSNSTSKLTFQLENEKGKSIVDVPVKIGSGANQNALVGVLSDDYTALNYLDGAKISNGYYDGKSQLLELNADMIPDQASGIEILSYLIINSYDTTNLTDAQRSAIKDWVSKGGTLIIGGGNDYKQTVSGFEDVLSIENAKSISAKFQATDTLAKGEDKNITFTDESGLIEPQIKGASSAKGIISESSLIKRYEYNKGSIIFTGFNLGMEPIVSWADKGTFATNLFNKSATGYAAQRVANISYGAGDDLWSTCNVIDNAMDDKFPHFTAIMIVLIIFILFSPIIYFVLKKLDKRELLWIIIPLSSICFTVIIFVVNSDIRIRYPISKSITVIYDQVDDDERTTSTTASLGIMVPGTSHTEVKTNEGMSQLKIYDINNVYYDGDGSKIDWNDDYTSSVKEGADGYVLGYDNQRTFQTKYINFEYTGESNAKDGLQTEYKRTVSGISGKVTNKSGYDMKQVCVLAYGKAVPLGDIKKGQSVEFGEQQNESFFDMDTNSIKYKDIDQQSEIYNQIITTYSMLGKYYNGLDTNRSEIYTIGYIDEYECDYIADNNVEEYNKGAYVKRENVGYSDYEDARVLNLFSYANQTDTWDMNDGQIYAQEVEVGFNLGEDVKKVYALIRAKDSDRKYGNTKNTKIYAWNYKTQQYDEIFTDDIIMKFKDDCPYLGEDGIIKLKFTIKTVNEDYAPFITVVGGEE